jgi:hypothetical protein
MFAMSNLPLDWHQRLPQLLLSHQLLHLLLLLLLLF